MLLANLRLVNMLNDFFNQQTNEGRQHLQTFFKWGLIGCGLILGLLYAFFWHQDKPTPKKGPTQEEIKKKIESGANRIGAEEVWKFKVEEENKRTQDEIKALKKMLSDLATFQGGEQERRLQNLEERLNDVTAQEKHTIEPESTQLEATQNQQSLQQQKGAAIQKITLALTPTGQKIKALKTVENTIPAGTFAKSVLLSGVEASAAMNASADPRPLLLRVVDPGTLPRCFKSDLKDCHITASGYGDLSSERVYARLEKLTCTEKLTGEIIETQVAGYIAGPDGKAGIRGKVIYKDGAFLARSMVGGIFSGLSAVANPENHQGMVNPFFAGNQKTKGPSSEELFKSGMAEGATSALDRLSQYYIDRAEQIQPVVSIMAGQTLDIVFTQGTAVGDTTVRQEIAKTRDQSRRQIAQDAAEKSTNLYQGPNS